MKKASPWAEKGFEIASEQIAVPGPVKSIHPLNMETLPSMQLLQGDDIVVKGSSFTAIFRKKEGSMTSYLVNGKEILAAPVLPNFWRVPTDSGEGGKNSSYAARWRASGLDAINIVPVAMKAEKVQPGIVKLTAENTVRLKKSTIQYTAIYTITIYGNGEVHFQYSFETKDDLPPLARVGVQFVLTNSLDEVAWYGRGPFESYEERKESAKVGLYRGKVAEQYFPYVMPQENGNKTDVRWLLLSSKEAGGICIKADSLLSMNVQDYSLQSLNASKTTHQLKKGEHTYVYVDLKQMGVGGDISWTPRVHPEYLLTAKKYEYGFWFKAAGQPIDGSKWQNSSVR